MAGFSYTKEEREFILNIAKIHRDDMQRSADNAVKGGDPLTVHALQYQIGIANSIIEKIEGVA